MAEIFDLLARVSWETNGAEIEKLNSELKKQDRTLDELRQKGKRLEDQLARTNDPKKQAALTAELKKTQQAQDSIVKSQKQQVEVQKQLAQRAKELAAEMQKANDPAKARALVQELRKVENQLDAMSGKAKNAGGALQGIGGKLGGFGQSLLSGIGLGGGMMSITTLVGGLQELGSAAVEEFEAAERSSRLLKGTLKNLGEEEYFDSLMREANQLAQQIGYLDNDDIVNAQQKLLTYGKLTKQEISSLLPVIIDFAARTGQDIGNATEVLIGALEGQGRSLKQYGINMRDAGTVSERLALIQEDLGNKVKGAAEEFARSSEGIKAAAEQQKKDILETYGEAAGKVELFFKQAVAGFYLLIKDLSKSESDWRKEEFKNISDDAINYAEGLSKKELEQQKKQNKLREMETQASLKRIAEMREIDRTMRLSTDEKMDIGFRIQNEESRIAKNTAQNMAVNKALRDFDAKEKLRQEELARVQAERKAAEDEEKAKKAAEARAAARKAAAEKEKQERERNWQAYLAAQKQFEDEQAKATMSAMDYELLKLKEHFDAIRAAYKKVGKDVTAINKLELTERAKIIDKSREVDRKFLKQAEDARKQEEKAKEESIKNEANALIERSKAAVAQRIADNKARAEQKQKDEEDARSNREKLYNEIINATETAQSILDIEKEKTDRLIELQQQRVDAARDNSKVSLKIEEDRLNALLERRQKYERAQRAIDAAVIVANQAVAISGAIRAITDAGGNPILIAANAIAIAASIAAAIAAVKSGFGDVGFKEGGYTGDGDANQESRTLGRKPYKYHKGEFVMDAELTSNHRDLFDGIHQRRLKVRQLDDGQYYIAPDVDKLSSDYQTAKYSTQDGQVLAELSAMRKLMQQREVNVTNNFDADGFGQAVATQMGHLNLKNLRRN